MSQPLHGVTADDFLEYATSKGEISTFCKSCDKELTPDDPTPYCLMCDDVYGDLQQEYMDMADEMILDDDMEQL